MTSNDFYLFLLFRQVRLTQLQRAKQHLTMDSEIGRPFNKLAKKKNGLPLTGERAVVRCPGFTCLAYRDPNGTWRMDKDDSELPQVLEVVFRFEQ